MRKLLTALAGALLIAGCGINTAPATEVYGTQAKINAQGHCDASDTSCYYSFGYRVHPNGAWHYTQIRGPVGNTNGTVSFGETITGLQPHTAYDYEVCGLGGQSSQPQQTQLDCVDSTGSPASGQNEPSDIPAGDQNASTFTTGNESDPQFASLITTQRQQAESIMNQFAGDSQHYANGEWDPTLYNTTQPDGYWEKEQWPAITEAVMSLYYHMNGNQAQADAHAAIARATVSQAIAAKQNMQTGYYGESGVVGGTFWAQAQGQIALILNQAGEVDSTTLTNWSNSLQHYASWLDSSGNDKWYINGNNNLRITLIMLEAWKLAQLTSSPYADVIHGWYTASQAFTMNPCTSTQCSYPSGAAGVWGWNQATQNSGYLSETPPGNPYPGTWGCANTGPCTGFDPYYTTLQLYDALTGYVLSGHDSWWQKIVTDEWHMEQPLLVDGGALNANNGSRHPNDGNVLFDPSVYAVLDNNNIETHDDLWGQQNTAMQNEFQSTEGQQVANIGPNSWGWISSPASGILDPLHNG
jgi:hypothetical protein